MGGGGTKVAVEVGGGSGAAVAVGFNGRLVGAIVGSAVGVGGVAVAVAAAVGGAVAVAFGGAVVGATVGASEEHAIRTIRIREIVKMLSQRPA